MLSGRLGQTAAGERGPAALQGADPQPTQPWIWTLPLTIVSPWPALYPPARVSS